MIKKWLIPLLIISASVVGFLLLKWMRPPAQPIAPQEQVWTVEVTTVQPGQQQPELLLYGRVESPRVATLRVPSLSQNSALTVLAVPHLAGETVRAGDLLVQLEDSDTQLVIQQREAEVNALQAQIAAEKMQHRSNVTALAQEKNLLQLAERSMDRVQRLEQQKLSSESALDEAKRSLGLQQLAVTNRQREIDTHPAHLQQLQANLSRAKALLAQAQLELSRTQLRAPFAGMLATVSVATGDRVRGGDTALSLYDHEQLEVRAQIPGRYQSLVFNALQQQIRLTASAQVYAQPVKLALNRVAGKIEDNSGGIDALFTLSQGANLLRLGQFITPILHLPAEPDVVVLPFSALYGTDRVYKMVDGRMQSVRVELVGEYRGDSEVTHLLARSNELQQGDPVIVTQLPNALNGLRVQTTQTPTNGL